MSPMLPLVINKVVRSILKYKKQTEKSKYTADLLRSAEQRINFVYMMLMIAFEAAILIYILINTWDDSRFWFGGMAAGILLAGIIINALFRKKTIRG